jgi:hypothetical protein
VSAGDTAGAAGNKNAAASGSKIPAFFRGESSIIVDNKFKAFMNGEIDQYMNTNFPPSNLVPPEWVMGSFFQDMQGEVRDS